MAVKTGWRLITGMLGLNRTDAPRTAFVARSRCPICMTGQQLPSCAAAGLVVIVDL